MIDSVVEMVFEDSSHWSIWMVHGLLETAVVSFEIAFDVGSSSVQSLAQSLSPLAITLLRVVTCEPFTDRGIVVA